MQSQPRLGTERPHRRRCDAVSGVRGPGGIARLSVGDPEGISRALLHVATDLPGHFPPGHHGGVGSGERGRRCSVPWSTGEVNHRGRILDAPVRTIPVVAGGTRSGRTCNWPPHLCARPSPVVASSRTARVRQPDPHVRRPVAPAEYAVRLFSGSASGG
ncbi:MAG: hypothetical protein QOG96_23 [Pseudonocardiales bacterium]|nr:hypothetical protein [Pseudonocardiales bacterium]